MTVRILHGDCREVLKTLADASVDSIVTDPPYELTSGKKGGTGAAAVNLDTPYGRSRIGTGNGAGGFMGMPWDATGVAFDVETWRQCLRALKPGGHMLAFSGTRTYHRMVCAIEDAGFEIRDQIGWLFGSGFPKSLDVSKAIDAKLGATRELTKAGEVKRAGYGGDWDTGSSSSRPRRDEPATDEARQWQGWGTALKPAWEPICVARKPLVGTVASNVLAHGTGALNIDACRVPTSDDLNGGAYAAERQDSTSPWAMLHKTTGAEFVQPTGRWPANLIHDGSDEVLAAFPQAPEQQAPESFDAPSSKARNVYGERGRRPGGFGDVGAENGSSAPNGPMYTDAGSAARFFYCAKASSKDRGANNLHPTVKPTALMRYLCRLVTPPGGTVLDPFLGSGSTGRAAAAEGFAFIGIELNAEYIATARERIAGDAPLFTEFSA